MLERLGMPTFLAMHPTVEEAVAQARSRPPYLRAELSLGPSATAPAAARRFVHDTCWQWRLHTVDDPKDPLAALWVDSRSTRPCWWPASWSPMRWSTPMAPAAAASTRGRQGDVVRTGTLTCS